MDWQNIKNIQSKNYKCGYCGVALASEKGYYAFSNIGGQNKQVGSIYMP